MDTYDKAYKHLSEFIESMEIVDTHEHLPSESDRLKRKLDFSFMFSHYCTSDLLASGMTLAEHDEFFAEDTPLRRKWEIFHPYYEYIHDGSYCHAARIAMKRFYGMDDLESYEDAERLTELLREANTEGLYKRVLRDACGIRVSLNFDGPASSDGLLLHVPFVQDYMEALPQTIRSLEDKTGISCATLNGYVEAVRLTMEQKIKSGTKGFKIPTAYSRDIHFAPVTYSDAEAVYNRILEEAHGWRGDAALGYEERRPIQDYMVHRFCEMAAEFDVPVVIHSALQTHCMHNMDNARPSKLWNLPLRYRRTAFIVLHSGFPWMEDAAVLAKQFPNMYLDFAWAHLMSPEITARILAEYVDLVPMHKIFGFGGDYSVVEKVYGHLVLARRSIVTALAHKVDLKDLTIKRAEAWIKAIMHDNPSRIYRV